MSALIEAMLSHGLAHRVDGDILAPLAGNSRVPHAVLVVGGQTTAVGRALDVALNAGQLPDPELVESSQREDVSIRRRQVVGLIILLLRSGLIEHSPVLSRSESQREGSRVNIPWTDRDKERRPPTEAEIEAFIVARDRRVQVKRS